MERSALRVGGWLLAAVVVCPRADAQQSEEPGRATVAAVTHSVELGSSRGAGGEPRSRLDLLAKLTLAYLEGDSATGHRYLARLSNGPDDAIEGWARVVANSEDGGISVPDATRALRQIAQHADSARRRESSPDIAALEALALVRASTYLVVRGHADEAAQLAARADSVRPPGDSGLAALASGARALAGGGDIGRAMTAVRASVASATRAGDGRDGTRELFAAASVFYARRGVLDSATLVLDEAIARAEGEKDLGVAGSAYQWRGYVLRSRGRYADARRDLLRAVTMGTAASWPAVVGWSELNLAALAHAFGDHAETLRHAAIGRAELAVVHDSAGLALADDLDGWAALDLGDTARARERFTAALAMTAAHGVGPSDLANAHVSLASVAFAEGAWTVARAELDSGDAIDRSNMDMWRDGRLALARGDVPGAVGDLEGAVRAIDSNDRRLRPLVRADLAQALVARGDTARAIAELTAASREIDDWRRRLSDPELRVVALSNDDWFGSPSGAVAAVIAAAAASGRTADAFALAEQRRARELADEMARTDAYGGVTSAGGGAPAIRGRLTTPVTLDEARRGLPDDSTAIVEYVTGPARSGIPTTVIALTRRATAAWLLPAVDSLSGLVPRLDALIDAGRPASAPERTLGDALLGPVVSWLPPRVTHLVIVADGIIHRVPFAVLVMRDGRGVVDRFALSRSPSATISTALWGAGRGVAPRPARILAFGDPIAPVGGDSEVGITRLPRLPWTAEEARLVGLFGDQSVVRLGREASARYLLSAPLSMYGIVHLATHAVVDEDAPARSGVALSGTDGMVGAAQMATLALGGDLVVLSACRTARGAIVAGEGVRGLTAPLLAAGARAVVATQWSVDDRRIVPIVYAFYAGLARGESADVALAAAEQRARAAGAPAREWAAFTLVGDPTVRERLRMPARGAVPEWVVNPVHTGGADGSAGGVGR
jgi:tetratricopeptide (TPR) repeat protein